MNKFGGNFIINFIVFDPNMLTRAPTKQINTLPTFGIVIVERS
jgi:hypothetical protein